MITHMTEVGLGRMHALGPKWVAGYGPCRKCPRLHLSHLFGQLSKVSSADSEASDPCCSGNQCTFPPDRCSGQSGLRGDLFTSFRFFGSFPCRSCCLCGLLEQPPSSAFLEGSPSSMPSVQTTGNAAELPFWTVFGKRKYIGLR